MPKLTAKFVLDRHCKNSVRFKPADEKAEEISKLLYFRNEGMKKLDYPKSVMVTIETEG